MPQSRLAIPELLDKLEQFYGRQEADWPIEPYEFLVWWHCGYPASDDACTRGWKQLHDALGTRPHELLKATLMQLCSALRSGGMFPELRAERLKEIARRVQDQMGGDLRGALTGTLSEARKTLKAFPGIADPGADRILLFAGIAPVAAIPSNAPHVLIRLRRGQEDDTYGKNYREAKRLIATEVPETLDARQRAFLLLKRHGQALCKRTKPKCAACLVSAQCAFCRGPSNH